MRQFLYWTGRFFQLVGLLLLPSAVWMTEVVKSEAGALLVFFGAIVIFFFELDWSHVSVI
ncbi:MAG: hypothetical protein HYU34_06085 [Candidatus Omnitrophica bacterium]|nr:hypothetical protein [Candidatus Omnitrophota bacterium]